MIRYALTAACLLLLTGCSPQEAEQRVIPSDGAGTESALPDLASCTNPEVGYAVRYPADWETNTGTVMPPCSLFDPEPIHAEPGTELPLNIAVAIRQEPVPFHTVAAAARSGRELMRQQSTVDGRNAVRVESEASGDLLIPEGVRSYRYLVDLGDATLIAATYDVGELDYERKKQRLDEMMASLDFTG